MDPISRRENGAGKNQPDVSSKKKSDSATTQIILEKAQQKLKAEKEQKAHKQRKLIFAAVVLVLVVFVAGALVLAVQQYQKDQQVKQAEETLQSAREKLAQLEIVKKLDDGQKEDFYKKAGAQYLAAEEVGIISNSEQDQKLLGFLLSSTPSADAAAEAVKRIIEARLAVVKTTGYYEGYIFNYWYGNTAVDWPAAYNVPRQGDPQALEEDKQYAMSQAKEDMDRLKTNKATPDAIIAEINSDFRLWMREDPNGSAQIASSISTPGNVGQSGKSAEINSIVSETIAKMSGPGYSDITTRKYISVYDVAQTPFDAGYFFVKLDKLVRGDAVVREYEQALAELEEQLK